MTVKSDDAPPQGGDSAVGGEGKSKRAPGDQETRFRGSARVQIVVEFSYLVIILFSVLAFLVLTFNWALVPGPAEHLIERGWLERTFSQPPMAMVAGLFLSGMAGGTAYTLKWLYHTVAKDIWFKDRLWWRLSIPWMGGLLGVFAIFIFSRTLGTRFDEAALDPHNFFPACGLSFLVGIFADGTLASLEKLANKTLGTLNDIGGP